MRMIDIASEYWSRVISLMKERLIFCSPNPEVSGLFPFLNKSGAQHGIHICTYIAPRLARRIRSSAESTGFPVNHQGDRSSAFSRGNMKSSFSIKGTLFAARTCSISPNFRPTSLVPWTLLLRCLSRSTNETSLLSARRSCSKAA